jgi:hypothetical protein
MEEQLAMEFIIGMRQAAADNDLDAMQELMHEYNSMGLLSIVWQHQEDHMKDIIKIMNN